MTEMQSIWSYDPNFPLAITGTILYGILTIIIGYQTIFLYRSWFFLPVVFGAVIEVVGYAMRAYSTQNQMEIVCIPAQWPPVPNSDTMGHSAPFAVTLSLVVLAPVFVAAGNFLLVGRLVRAVLPPSRHTIFGLPARFITRFFVTCDVMAFCIQGSGSGTATGSNWMGPAGAIGVNIIIAGLVFQFVAFSAYMCVFVRFHMTARKAAVQDAAVGWMNVVMSVYISSSMIMIRCIYRVAEFAEGMEGYAFKNEWMFWVFECIPMLIAIGVFCWWHPSRYLGRDGAKGMITNKSGESTEGSELAQQTQEYERMGSPRA